MFSRESYPSFDANLNKIEMESTRIESEMEKNYFKNIPAAKISFLPQEHSCRIGTSGQNKYNRGVVRGLGKHLVHGGSRELTVLRAHRDTNKLRHAEPYLRGEQN